VIHVYPPVIIQRSTWSFQLETKGRENFHWGACQCRTGRRVKLLVASFHPTLQTRCSGETGGITRLETLDEELFLTSRVYHSSAVFSHRSFSFLRFTVSFSQKHGFPLKTAGSPSILTVKTWQYLLKTRVWGSFCFLLLSSLYRRFVIFVITRSLSPKHIRGESEWIRLRLWIRLRFHELRAQHALVNYTLLRVNIMTSTLVTVFFSSCSISKWGHPRMVSLSVASISALNWSFRYLRSL
jgi:hypothetical protein